jgi:starch phosphorylase
VRKRIRDQHFRNQGSEAHLDRVLKLADPANPHALTIGFGRRFATYKRATLLFDDLDWLREIVGDPKRPVLFLFSGKAHPADEPGKAMIKRVIEVSRMPEFEGKILFVEGYDLRLARRLVSGVDVWLNNPIFPMEASGTSGMKAGVQRRHQPLGPRRLVGRGLPRRQRLGGEADFRAPRRRPPRPRGEPRHLRAAAGPRDPALLRARQPRLFARVDPHVEALDDVADARVQQPPHGGRLRAALLPAGGEPGEARRGGCYASARDLAAWKAKVRNAWPNVRIRALETPQGAIGFGSTARFAVAAQLAGLDPRDLLVELLISSASPELAGETSQSQVLAPRRRGGRRAALRARPRARAIGKAPVPHPRLSHHPALTHRFEMGSCMV